MSRYCPDCHGELTELHGLKIKKRKFYCYTCKKSWVINPTGRPHVDFAEFHDRHIPFENFGSIPRITKVLTSDFWIDLWFFIREVGSGRCSDYKNSRVNKRVRLYSDIVTHIKQKDNNIPSVVGNISMGGILFTCYSYLPKNTDITVTLDIEKYHYPITLQAKVKYCHLRRKNKEDYYYIGAMFVNLLPEQISWMRDFIVKGKI